MSQLPHEKQLLHLPSAVDATEPFCRSRAAAAYALTDMRNTATQRTDQPP